MNIFKKLWYVFFEEPKPVVRLEDLKESAPQVHVKKIIPKTVDINIDADIRMSTPKLVSPQAYIIAPPKREVTKTVTETSTTYSNYTAPVRDDFVADLAAIALISAINSDNNEYASSTSSSWD